MWAIGAVASIFLLVLLAIHLTRSGEYRGPVSDHFDGSVFRNESGTRDRPSLLRALTWNLNRERAVWPEREAVAPGPRPPERVGNGELRVTFVGHATVLIQVDGLNLLIDPVWSDRIGPFSWLGATRHRSPGIRFEDLPPIDLVLVSHDHYDHLDLPTLKRLDSANPGMKSVVPLGVGGYLAKNGIKAESIELDWWQERSIGTTKITAIPAAHWSGRGVGPQNRTLWVGYFIAGSRTVYCAGDTGWGPHFKEVRERLGRPQLAILPVGAYKPRWFMSPQHIDPAEAVAAAKELGAQVSIPIHYGTFNLADDGPTEALDDLSSHLVGGDSPAFLVLKEGEGRSIENVVPEDLMDGRTE